MAEPWAEVIESHYLETTEGLFFAVKGLVHPPGRVLACLRYAPDPSGDRQSSGLRYRRLYHFAEQEAFLAARYPHYLAFDPICRATLQSVPHPHVRQILDPRARLQQLAGRAEDDPVAADCVALAALLSREAGIAPSPFGVSGSLLIGLHTPSSDLDLTVYGRREGRAVQAALRLLLAGHGASGLGRLDAAGVQMLYAERSLDTHMGFVDFLTVERRKVNQGVFRGRPYFIRFVLAPSETGERYGDYRYEPVGWATITGTVTDGAGDLFTPCRYPLDRVRFLTGAGWPDLREIVSFRGRFCEQAGAGDVVRASGLVERVEDRGGRVWHRLLLGNAADDTMILAGVA